MSKKDEEVSMGFVAVSTLILMYILLKVFGK